MLTNIKLSNFRIHESTNIDILEPFVALVGKNDVGKSSVLEALDILCNRGKPMSDDDKTKDSTVSANIIGTFDGRILDYSSPILNEEREDIDSIFQKFGVEDNNHFIDLNQDLNALISLCNNNCRLFIERTYQYRTERKKIEELLSIFTNLRDLYFNTQSTTIKGFIDDYLAGNRDLQRIISKKQLLFSNSQSSAEKKCVKNIFKILEQFETNIQKVLKCNGLNIMAQKNVKDFEDTGDSNLIKSIDLISIDEQYKYDEDILFVWKQPYYISWVSEENSDPEIEKEWSDFTQKIYKTYLNGGSNIFNILFFKEYENHDLEDLFFEGSLDEIINKSDEILARFDQYVKTVRENDIAYLWEQYLNSFGSKNINLAKRGSGFKRLCEIYYFTMSALSKIRNNSQKHIILAVEEPEISLHPSQQRDIVQRLQDILKLPNTQVLITTHSPFIVNELKEENVCILKQITQTDAHGNTTETISTEEMSKRILKYPSMAEINYLAFDEPSMTYHQELFCHIEIEWEGKSNGDPIRKILDKLYKISSFKNCIDDLLQNYYMLLPDLDSFTSTVSSNYYKNLLLKHQFYREDQQKTIEDYCICRCVRDAIDHTSTKNYEWKNDNIVELSLKILLVVAQYFEKAKELLKNYSDAEGLNLDNIGNKEYIADGDAKQHTLSYCCWYYVTHPNTIIKKGSKEEKMRMNNIVTIVQNNL